MPHFRGMIDRDSVAIHEAVEKLCSASGFIDTPRLRKRIANWVEEKRLEASRTWDVVKDTYRKRAAVIGFRCGVIYRLIIGKESNACLDFAAAMAEYVLQTQMQIFGNPLLTQMGKTMEGNERRSRNKNILEELPQTFTLDDLNRLKPENTNIGTLRVMIHRWKADGWIEKVKEGEWKKIVTV